MIKGYNIIIRKIFSLVSLFCIFAFCCNGQATISMSTANCTISSNEVQMDILVTNTGKVDLRWNSCVIRMNIPAAILPPGTQTYEFNYLGGSDFPLSFPSAGKACSGANFNAVKNILLWVSSPSLVYNNHTCSAPLIAAGQTKQIGRFSFKITSSTFQKGAAAITWHTTSSCILYEACSHTTLGFGNSGNRVLAEPCMLTVPE